MNVVNSIWKKIDWIFDKKNVVIVWILVSSVLLEIHTANSERIQHLAIISCSFSPPELQSGDIIADRYWISDMRLPFYVGKKKNEPEWHHYVCSAGQTDLYVCVCMSACMCMSNVNRRARNMVHMFTIHATHAHAYAHEHQHQHQYRRHSDFFDRLIVDDGSSVETSNSNLEYHALLFRARTSVRFIRNVSDLYTNKVRPRAELSISK